MESKKLWIGVCEINVRIPGASSLKDRRQVVRSMTDLLKKHCGASVSDLGPDGIWDAARIASVCAGSSHSETLERTSDMSGVARGLEDRAGIEVIDISEEVFEYGDV